MRRNPEVVVVLGTEDIRDMKVRGEGADLLLNDQVLVLEHPSAMEGELVETLDARGLLRPGALLVRSPYDDLSYAEQSEARELFAKQKHFAFSTLCSLLGARSVTVEVLVERTQEGTRSISLGAGGKVASGTLKAEDRKLLKLAESLQLEDAFEGGDADVEAARGLLTKKRLLNDPLMSSLLELADSGNRHLRRRVTLNLTEESGSAIKLAGHLKIPAYIKVDGQAQEKLRESREYSLVYQVEF